MRYSLGHLQVCSKCSEWFTDVDEFKRVCRGCGRTIELKDGFWSERNVES